MLEGGSVMGRRRQSTNLNENTIQLPKFCAKLVFSCRLPVVRTTYSSTPGFLLWLRAVAPAFRKHLSALRRRYFRIYKTLRPLPKTAAGLYPDYGLV